MVLAGTKLIRCSEHHVLRLPVKSMTKTCCLIHTVCQKQRRFPRSILKQSRGLTADRTAAWLGGALVKILAGWPPPWFWGVWGKASPGLPSAAPTGPRGLTAWRSRWLRVGIPLWGVSGASKRVPEPSKHLVARILLLLRAPSCAYPNLVST